LILRKPENGIQYLIEEKFVDNNPRSIAEFLFNRNCLSKIMIGNYISNTQDPMCRLILKEFIKLIDLRHLPVDEGLRKFQQNFRMPGEAQKIEYLTQSFASHYIMCNKLECEKEFNCAEDTIDVLAYAIILLNTSIHNPNVKPGEKMKFEQFVRMTKSIDSGHDLNPVYLQGIYERVKKNEFKTGRDHITSVIELQKTIVGPKKPNNCSFVLPHRRLVCLVQLNEVIDITKKEKHNLHQRDCFLYNDILVVTIIN
jgi:Sec7-like guanine-nucleotide exchange factor